MTKQIDCGLCGAPNALYVIKTGVSAYFACRDCFTYWEASDHTLEALTELKARKERAAR